MKLICEYCNVSFIPKTKKTSRFCSKQCRDKWWHFYRNPRKTKECQYCKKTFVVHENGATTKFCSQECRDLHNSTRFKGRDFKSESWYKNPRKNNRCGDFRKRFEASKIIDRDISWKTVIKKYGCNCALCNKPVDEEDFFIDERGYYHFGKNYPSVDHIKPRSKGGLHSWDNVQLAHFGCNTLKRDRWEYGT